MVRMPPFRTGHPIWEPPLIVRPETPGPKLQIIIVLQCGHELAARKRAHEKDITPPLLSNWGNSFKGERQLLGSTALSSR